MQVEGKRKSKGAESRMGRRERRAEQGRERTVEPGEGAERRTGEEGAESRTGQGGERERRAERGRERSVEQGRERSVERGDGVERKGRGRQGV